MRPGPIVVAVMPCLAVAACLPSYAFTDPSNDGGGGDAGDDSNVKGDSTTPGADGAADAVVSEAGSTSGADVGATDGPHSDAGITLDVGFPITAEINDAEGTTLSKTFDVPSGGRMLVAVVVWGEHGGSGVWPVTFASPHLTWTSAVQSVSMPNYVDAVGVGIWTAWAGGALSGETTTATSSMNVQADALLAIYSLAGASPSVGATGTSSGFGNSDGPLSFTVNAQAGGSFIVGGLLDGIADPNLHGNTLGTTLYDLTLASASGDALAVGRFDMLTGGAGNVTVGQDESVSDDVAAGVEILRAPP